MRNTLRRRGHFFLIVATRTHVEEDRQLPNMCSALNQPVFGWLMAEGGRFEQQEHGDMEEWLTQLRQSGGWFEFGMGILLPRFVTISYKGELPI